MSTNICKTRQQILNEGQIINNSDGTISVYTISSITGLLAPFPLTKPCCEILGQGTYFDVETQKCRWSTQDINSCDDSLPLKLVLNTIGNDGSYFYNIPDETCTLMVEFDYMFKFDCNTLSNFINGQKNNCQTLNNIFENISASMIIDVVDNTQTGPVLENVYEEVLFGPIGPNNLQTYLNNNINSSGFYICAENSYTTGCTDIDLYDTEVNTTSTCKPFIQEILTSLSGVPKNSFATDWINFKTEITDESLLASIVNKKIKLTIKISGTCVDVCLMLDNIKLNKLCTKVDKNDIYISKSLGFELDKIIDNKKSWVSNNSETHRVFDIKNINNQGLIRQTDYYLNNSQQIINTKEIDLDINIATAIETDVWCYISDNTCILTGNTIGTTLCIKDAASIDINNNISCTTKTYCCSETCGDFNVDIDKLLLISTTGITTIEDFKYHLTSELIDVKNRKIISSYPTLRLLYDRYINSLNFCGTNSSKFDYFTMNEFANLIGGYWVDLIEQVIPATTIWGSTRVYTNTIFDTQKFKYKNGTILFGKPTFNVVTSIATGATCDVDIKTIVLDGNNSSYTLYDEFNYNTAYINQINSGSEFIGTVNISGPSGSSGQVLNECALNVSVVTTNDTGVSDGSVRANITGAYGNVTYEWYNGETLIGTSQTITGLSAGTYNVIARDTSAQDCVVLGTGIVNPLSFAAEICIHDSCENACNCTMTDMVYYSGTFGDGTVLYWDPELTVYYLPVAMMPNISFNGSCYYLVDIGEPIVYVGECNL